MNGLSFINSEGKRDVISTRELFSVGSTHSHRQYAYGERPMYTVWWKRFIYNRCRYTLMEDMCAITGKTRRHLQAFITEENLRMNPLPPVASNSVKYWRQWELDVLLKFGNREASRVLHRSYEACKKKRYYLLQGRKSRSTFDPFH